MHVSKIAVIFCLLGLIIYSSCSTAEELKIALPASGVYFDNISDYGLFTIEDRKLIPNEELVSYGVTNPLFSDYAEKDRFIYMPQGQKAKLKSDGFFEWPEGVIIVKNFWYSESQTGENRTMETRLLIKELTDWKAISYVWNEQQTEAKISKVGAMIPMVIEHGAEKLAFDYVVPNKNQCKSCHNYNEKIDPLGFKFSNLNHEIEIDGKKVNQLSYLNAQGLIEAVPSNHGLSSMVSYVNENNDIQARALGYLEMNCGHCHRPEGPGNTSGLFLQHHETRVNHLGFCKGPVAAGKGSGGRAYDISPGSADASILYFRMKSLDPGEMMPEIGRSLVHQEGLELVAEWINGLEYDCDSQEGL